MNDPTEKKVAAYHAWQKSLLSELNKQHKASRLTHGVIIHTDQASDLSAFLWQLATDLICENEQTDFHCNECRSCQLMSSNSFPDMLWLSKAYDEKKKKLKRDISVDQVRDLIHQLSLTNQFNTLKIAVIYPAEALNNNAANSILKTLEEPEPDTLIILATHKLGRLPVTIRSRCQQFKLPQADKQQRLEMCAEHQIDEATVNQMAQQGITDPVMIVDLIQQDFLELQQQCENKTLRYINQDPNQDLVSLSSDLAALSLPLLRFIVNGFVDKLIRFHLKVYSQSSMHQVFSTQSAEHAQALYKVKNKIQQQLMFEENNLSVQLQIDDVLISLKNIFSGK